MGLDKSTRLEKAAKELLTTRFLRGSMTPVEPSSNVSKHASPLIKYKTFSCRIQIILILEKNTSPFSNGLGLTNCVEHAGLSALFVLFAALALRLLLSGLKSQSFRQWSLSPNALIIRQSSPPSDGETSKDHARGRGDGPDLMITWSSSIFCK